MVGRTLHLPPVCNQDLDLGSPAGEIIATETS